MAVTVRSNNFKPLVAELSWYGKFLPYWLAC